MQVDGEKLCGRQTTRKTMPSKQLGAAKSASEKHLKHRRGGVSSSSEEPSNIMAGEDIAEEGGAEATPARNGWN